MGVKPHLLLGDNMKYKNISKGTLNLESGACKAGESAECTTGEVRFLLPMGRIEVAKKVIKPIKKKKLSD